MKQAISKIDPPAALTELEANGKLEASVAVEPKLKTKVEVSRLKMEMA